MEDAAASDPLPQHRTTVLMTAAPPSPSLSSCLLAERKKNKKRNKSLSLSFVSSQNNDHLLTTAGARECVSSCVSEHGCSSKFPAYFLLPASRRRCSAYKHITASTILWSCDLGHYQIRAITGYNSSLHSGFLRQCS